MTEYVPAKLSAKDRVKAWKEIDEVKIGAGLVLGNIAAAGLGVAAASIFNKDLLAAGLLASALEATVSGVVLGTRSVMRTLTGSRRK